MTDTSTDLTQLDLGHLEGVIERGLTTFIEVGNALTAIRDGRKYQDAGFETFEAYCRDRWGWTRARAYHLMEAADTASILETSTNVDIVPRSEGQVRSLGPLAREDPEQARQAWAEAVEAAGGGQPTGAQVTEVVQRYRAPANELPSFLDEQLGVETGVSLPDEEERQPRVPQVLNKPDLGGTSHPARYSAALPPKFVAYLDRLGIGRDVLDPMAGPGGIHVLQKFGFRTKGVEIEEKWARQHPDTDQGDSTALTFADESFDAIVTSPTYGNRLADDYDASDPESRRSYRFDLGQELTPNNSGGMQWGPEYRDLHRAAWPEAVRVLRPGGLFILNIKDHVRAGVRQHVAGWHVFLLSNLGMRLLEHEEVGTPTLRQGANGELRYAEQVYVFRKGDYV